MTKGQQSLNFRRFEERGGFKLLAQARLSAPAAALIFNLLNELVAHVEEVVTSAAELAHSLGVSERQVKSALVELKNSGIIQLTERNGTTCLLKMNLDPTQWQEVSKASERKTRSRLGDAKNVRTLHPQPPVPNGSQPVDMSSIEVLHGREPIKKRRAKSQGTEPSTGSVEHEAIRIFEAFLDTRGDGVESDRSKELSFAHLLAESHPTEHVLQLLTHYRSEIASLSLLAGAWVHYFDAYQKHQEEHVSLESYRKKHSAAEKQIRSLAQTELKKLQAHKSILNSDEQLLLSIFLRHEHPRKQLYWALKVRERYPHLHDFFAVTADLALPPGNGDLHPRKN